MKIRCKKTKTIEDIPKKLVKTYLANGWEEIKEKEETPIKKDKEKK